MMASHYIRNEIEEIISMKKGDEYFMKRAIQMAEKGMDINAGGPFGCVIVQNGNIIAEAHNEVGATNDPTAHAEVVAIRRACESLQSFQLEDCIIYTSCEPCPMCIGAIYWARPKAVFYACTREDADAISFDDNIIYRELEMPSEKRSIPFRGLMRKEALVLFRKWEDKDDKIMY
jgi:guanine deaminase